MKLTRNKVLELTDNGRMLFEAYLPELNIVGDRGESNITSPFTNKPKSFSIYSWKKWMFKDFSQDGEYGDIFSFVALLNNFDLKADFVKILDVIKAKMLEMGSLSDTSNDVVYFNKKTNDRLVLASTEFSKSLIEESFKLFHPLMEGSSGFTIRLVKSFTKQDSKKVKSYDFKWEKSRETFFAITVEEGKYYVLYNPTTRETYEWGIKQENYVIGWRESLNIMFVENIYIRQTLVITNSITVMLNLHALSIPCIAFITEDSDLTAFFHIVIKPQFNTILLMFDGIINDGYAVSSELRNFHNWPYFNPKFSYKGNLVENLEPWQFFRDYGKIDEAIEAIFDKAYYVDDEYELDEMPQSIIMQ